MKKLRSKLGIWLMQRAYDIMPADDKATFDTISYYGFQVLVQMRTVQAAAAARQQQAAATEALDADALRDQIISSISKPRLH